jgi:hypothetical protein
MRTSPATVRNLWRNSLALVLLVFAVFAPVRHHEFVDFDDAEFIVSNPQVAAGLSATSVRWAFSHAYDATGGPLTWLSHMTDVELFGMRPGPQHLTNVALHALNAVLLLVLLYSLTGALAPSTFAAALFAVHPLHAESVAWISERKDVLSTAFALSATIAYAGYARRGGLSRYSVVIILFVLGLLAKPVVAVMPAVWLLLDVWPLRRRPRLIEKLPFVVLAIIAMAFTLSAQRAIGAVTATSRLAWPVRVANAVLSYATYLWQTVWPANLAVFYPYRDPAGMFGRVVLAAIVMLTCSVIAWRAARTRRYVAVGWWWYVLTLVPMIGLVQVGSHAHADRFTYVPLIGIFIALAWTLWEWASASAVRRTVVTVAAATIVFACAVTARAQVNTWRTSETMWLQARAATGNNFRAEAGLAEAARRRGDLDAAISHYQTSVSLAPDAADFQVNLALLLGERGRVAEAASAFERAVALRPNDAESHNNLGAMLARLGQWQDAAAQFRRALEISPTYELARRNLDLALQRR